MTAEHILERAESLLERRNLAHAVMAFNHAELLGAPPDRCSSGRWLAAMLRGDFQTAWRESDAIRGRGAPDPNRFWQGEDILGKRVMLRCLHGFGDAVQFLRYAPQLRLLASELIVQLPPAMLEIAPCFEGVGETITWGQDPEWDVQMEIIELPYAFRTHLEDLPIATNYLHLPPAALRAVAPMANSPDNLRVGLVWGCGEWNPNRSLPLQLLRPLTRVPGCEFWNLQGGPPREQWGCLGNGRMLHDARSCSDTVLKLAALIAQLDLVITPDTLAAHLAGALGTPAWVMVEHASDWRWMHGRMDSPWYPSLRIFRQSRPGDWAGVARDVQFALALLAGSRAQLTPERRVA